MHKNLFPRMHVSLYVSDLQKSVEFYTSFFGVQPNKVKPQYAKYILEEPSLIISFVENKERVSENFGHLGFQVETVEDMNLRLWEAKKKNLVAKEEIGTTCCYAKQDKFWVNDPDGVQWEVYYFHEDVEFNDPHYESTEASACCTPEQKEKSSSTKTTDNTVSTGQGDNIIKEKSCC
jgi:catechol 2,3-dioxygenase-like lactoylglutathione lyase family enzyme